MKKSVKCPSAQSKFFNESITTPDIITPNTQNLTTNIPSREVILVPDELERILPVQNIPEIQEYLLHEYGYSWAEYRTNSREKLIDYIEKNTYEVIQILSERNYNGLYDFRIIVRKRGNKNESISN